MKKVILMCLVLLGTTLFAESSQMKVGVINEQDFKKVGISDEAINKAKIFVLERTKEHKILVLEREQLSIEINKYMLNGAEKNWDKISETFDKIGKIEAEIMKNRLKGKLEMNKVIPERKYLEARQAAIDRIEGTKSKEESAK